MAKGLNKVQLIGHLGAAPEIKYTASATALCKFSLATGERYADKNGQTQERTEWRRVVVWGKLAEICGQCLRKGSLVYVEGSILTRSFNDEYGNKKTYIDIVAREVQFLGGSQGGQQSLCYETPKEDMPF